MSEYFFRTGERTWITGHTPNHNQLIDLRKAIKREWPSAMIQIIQDVQFIDYSQQLSIKDAIAQAFNNGVQSLGYGSTVCHYHFMQITLMNDIDNSEFIMNPNAEIARLAGYCYFGNGT